MPCPPAIGPSSVSSVAQDAPRTPQLAGVAGATVRAAIASPSNSQLAAGSVALTSSPNPSTYGRPVSLTATVTAGATGTVTFYDGVTVLGVGRLAGGAASLSTIFLPAGRRTLRARYNGDTNYSSGLSSPITQAVQAV